jgi:signal peptidase I
MLALKALALLFGTAVIAALAARILLGPDVRMYRVPSRSMEPTVGFGEKVTANFGTYEARAPRLGDVVLVASPSEDGAECPAEPPAGKMCAIPSPGGGIRYVRRIVGLPGDRLSLEHGRVVRNGRPLAEPYARACIDEYYCEFPKPIVVPPGSYYALGDNRGSSFDSRLSGPVPRKSVLARVEDCAPVIRYFCHAKS